VKEGGQRQSGYASKLALGSRGCRHFRKSAVSIMDLGFIGSGGGLLTNRRGIMCVKI